MQTYRLYIRDRAALALSTVLGITAPCGVSLIVQRIQQIDGFRLAGNCLAADRGSAAPRSPESHRGHEAPLGSPSRHQVVHI